MPNRNRPERLFGITLIGTASIIIGLIGALPSFFHSFLLLIYCIRGLFEHESMSVLHLIPFMFAVLLGGSYLLLFISGILLLKLRPLGRKIILYLSPLFDAVIVTTTGYVSLLPFLHSVAIYKYRHYLWTFIVSTIIFSCCIYYLTRSKVKEQFK